MSTRDVCGTVAVARMLGVEKVPRTNLGEIDATGKVWRLQEINLRLCFDSTAAFKSRPNLSALSTRI